jgi:hypothetical protein
VIRDRREHHDLAGHLGLMLQAFEVEQSVPVEGENVGGLL